MQDHKYNLAELDNMIPWERELYVIMLMRHLEEERQKMESQKEQY